MQVTMNQIDTYTTTTKGNSVFDVFKTVAKKITTALTPARKSKFSNVSVVEAIEYIEWRTKYDQRRIIQHVNVLTALAQSPKLCSSLDIKEPTYTSKWLKDDQRNIQSRTRELLSRDYPKNNTASARVVDNNRFDVLLSKFTGYLELDPRTQALMSGKGVANAAVHRSLRKRLEDILAYDGDNVDMLSLQSNMNMLTPEQILASAQAQLVEEVQSYEERILNEMRSLIDTLAASTEEEQIIEVKVTPVAEPQVQTKLSKKMTIKELKLYAKAHKIHVPGRKTKHRDIFEYIKESQQA